MKKAISAVVGASLLLAACAQNPVDNAIYQQDMAQCQAGNQDACTAAQYQGQKVAAQQAQDQQTAATAAVGVGAVALGVLAGIAAAHGGGYYHPYYRHW